MQKNTPEIDCVCEKCGAVYVYREAYLGKRATCPECGQRTVVAEKQDPKCQACGVRAPRRIRSQVSGAGLVVFVLLLLFFFPICWLGLFIQERQVYCSKCGSRAG